MVSSTLKGSNKPRFKFDPYRVAPMLIDMVRWRCHRLLNRTLSACQRISSALARVRTESGSDRINTQVEFLIRLATARGTDTIPFRVSGRLKVAQAFKPGTKIFSSPLHRLRFQLLEPTKRKKPWISSIQGFSSNRFGSISLTLAIPTIPTKITATRMLQLSAAFGADADHGRHDCADYMLGARGLSTDD